jgi:hypothetical protein
VSVTLSAEVAMSGKALVSGCDDRVEQVAAALGRGGAEVISVGAPAELLNVAAGLDPDSLSYYIQLPVSVDVAGSTLVGRVQTFLEKGLLARFAAADAVLPALREDATVVLVSGTTAIDGGGMPDDRAARFALLNVLAHAIRAEKAPGVMRVRILGADTTAAEVAAVALRTERPRLRAMAHLQAREAEMSYADWRIEVMGLATVQV